MKIISWNCRGLGNGSAVRSLLELGRVEDPDVLFLSETRLYEKELEHLRWKLGLVNLLVWNPEGRSRGIALFWRRGVDVTLRSYGRRHMDVDVKEGDNPIWRLTGVYGESATERKKETWRTLKILKQQHQQGKRWLCVGDFNEILSEVEKVGGAPRAQHMINGFREALEVCEMADLGFEGDVFTWRNHSKDLNTYICERLDRTVGNEEWRSQFPNHTVVNGIPRHSDHMPIIVHTEGEDRRWMRGDRGFRFEARWLQEEGCEEIIRKAWERSWTNRSGGVAAALRSVAETMREWDKNVVGELEGRLR
ncbi:uncharacterized protein [Aegilops tauschii subsp. strangulata]|uniref:uncharacterized protein n=1 Tax=Aegilops tauschii subsp. strangulata TaxID=200361 RepID=UPI003CC8DB59